jgi:uncharacterized protein
MDGLKLANFMDPRHFELIILPTEQCNFRCTYCYEDFEIGQMRDATVQAIKILIANRMPKLRTFTISWFGGEPLMAKHIMLELNKFSKDLCDGAGVRFTSSITTNAFGLDLDTFNALVGYNLRSYQISIDGDEDGHNQTRKLISGRGSFNKIWSNLLAMRRNTEPFNILLRVHIHQDNLDSVRRLLPKLQAEFGADPRFAVFLKPVGNWGGSSVKKMTLIKKEDDVVAELNATLRELGWFAARPNTRTYDTENESVVSPCYAAKSNSLVIRADGTLAKCTVAFNDTRNSVGRINDDGTLHIENPKMRQFMRGFQSLEAKELYCPMEGMPAVPEVKVMTFEKNPRAARAPLASA